MIAEITIAVGVKHGLVFLEVFSGMLALAIWAVKIGGRQRRLVALGAPVANICPQAAFPGPSLVAIEHRNRRVVAVEPVSREHMGARLRQAGPVAC
jgi:hypothetical protein